MWIVRQTSPGTPCRYRISWCCIRTGKDTAHYCDRAGFSEVPEFLQERQPELTPDDLETGERIRTPRGSFMCAAMTREQMEAAGYGVHHISDDGKYLIMGNGTRAFAVERSSRKRTILSAPLK